MKSHALLAVDIYGCIFSDAADRWIGLRSQLERSFLRLRRDVEARGLPFIAVTLPSLGKALDRALDKGDASDMEIPQGIAHKGHRPLIFKGLWELVFDDLGVLREDADVEAVFFLRQICLCCKKLRLECPPQAVKETLDEFFSIEEHLPKSYPGTWDCEVPSWEYRFGHPLWGSFPREDDLFELPDIPSLPYDSLRALCMRVIKGELGWMPSWDLFPRHGPGAVSEQGSGVKYDFRNWPRKLNGIFPFDWFGSGQIDTDYVPEDRELPSRLLAVPKTLKGPRLICAEPLAHQWIQQSIWRWLEGRISQSELLRRSITFRSQETSRSRALTSSLSSELVTIDLSSASDRVSTRLVEYVFQGSNILDGLHACRTRAVRQNLSSRHPEMVLLRKFSTMGSACTFPIQSIVFFILTLWALRLSEGNEGHFDGLVRDARRITVFGDDIIAPTTAYDTIRLVLETCGLKVNMSKTFGGLNFRESCGMDAFRGVDVTPAYLLEPYDGSPSSMATTIESSNNFHIRGLWRTADCLVNQLPHNEVRRLWVSRVGEDGVLGLRSFSSGEWGLTTQWDPDIQRMYYEVLTISAKVSRERGSGRDCLTQYFTEAPDQDYPWLSGQVSRVKLRKSLTRVYR